MNCPTYYPAYPYRIRPQISYYDHQRTSMCYYPCPPQCVPNYCETNSDCSNNDVCHTPAGDTPADHTQDCDSIPLHMALDDDNSVLTEHNCNETIPDSEPEQSCDDTTNNVYVIKIPKKSKVRIKS